MLIETEDIQKEKTEIENKIKDLIYGFEKKYRHLEVTEFSISRSNMVEVSLPSWVSLTIIIR